MSATMNISLPETLKEYVKERVREGRYSNPSDYVRALIRADQERAAARRLEALLLEGLASGEPTPLDNETFHAIKSEVRARVARKLRA
jgi:antitoxin ParD1/3/4